MLTSVKEKIPSPWFPLLDTAASPSGTFLSWFLSQKRLTGDNERFHEDILPSPRRLLSLREARPHVYVTATFWTLQVDSPRRCSQSGMCSLTETRLLTLLSQPKPADINHRYAITILHKPMRLHLHRQIKLHSVTVVL